MGKPQRHSGKWRIRWTDETGRRRSEVYDDKRDAVFHLQRHQLHVEEVKRGLREPARREDHTFEELCEYWLERRAPLKRSPKDDESIIRCHLRPAFGGLPVHMVGVDVVDDPPGPEVTMSRAARPQQLPSGRWRIRWLDADGARRSTAFDRYYDAEHALRERQVEAERIRAGLQSRRPEDHTFSELCDYWMEHRASRKRSTFDIGTRRSPPRKDSNH